MRSNVKKNRGQKAFTIVELLTVMSVIMVLIGILLPGLNMVRRYARQVKQKAQFHAIEVSMNLFNAEFEEYPPSEQFDMNLYPSQQVRYCGAMKLAEAMIGQDKLGFHRNSRFRQDGTFDGTVRLYNLPQTDMTAYKKNLESRVEYLTLANANAYKLGDIYTPAALNSQGFTATIYKDKFVLCDVYTNVNNLDPTGSGKGKIGMPILYYRANTSQILHDPANSGQSTYNYKDNDDLVKLGIPWQTSVAHPMASTGTDSTGAAANPQVFYDKIQDKQITSPLRPQNPKSYILMSAGFDGEYGTADDIFNF